MFSFFEKRLNPFPSDPPSQPPKGIWAFCRHYTRGYEKYLAAMALLTGIISSIEVLLMSFLGRLVDWLTLYTPQNFWSETKPEIIGVSIVLLVVLPCCVLLHNLFMHQAIIGNYPMAIRWRAHRYLLGQSLSFYQDEFAGRIATKLMQTSLAVREAVMKVLDVLLYVSVYFTGIVILVATLDLRLAIPLLIWLSIYICMLRIFVPRLREVSMNQANTRSEMTGRIVDTYTNINTVKLFSHSKREEDYSQEGMSKFLKTVHPQMRLVTLLSTSLLALNVCLIFSTAALSVWLWTEAAVGAGAIAAAIAVVLRVYSMSQWIMWEVSSVFEHIGSVQDGINTLSQPHTVSDKENAPPLSITSGGGIAFKDISFNYNKNQALITHFSLTIQPGEKVGIVGRSGAGKSTLVNLLLRFYDLNSGSIEIDGQDIASVQQESLRQNISVVTQDTSLLHRSIRENIMYGRPDANEQEIIQAAKKAQAHDFINALSDVSGNNGYDVQVGERGVKLSGGQRQRIAITRVLLKNAPILVLDEATSALDSEVEAAIQENLNHLMADKTVIAIAHRLSTIASLDRLIVLDEGKIVEEGTHTELLRIKGLYAQLWERQSGGFIA